MPRLNIFNRDDELRPHISSRVSHVQPPRISGRLRLGKRAGQPAGRQKAVGLHLPRSTHGGAHGVSAVVKAKYVSVGRSKGLTHYLEKDKHQDRDRMAHYLDRDDSHSAGQRAQLMTRDGPASEDDRQAFVDRSHRDPRLWHLIISPKDGQSLDLDRLATSTLRTIEEDTGLKLDAMYAIHRDTKTPHIHMLVRGRSTDGQNFRLEKDYISHGMRQRVEEIAERQRTWQRLRTPAHSIDHTQDRTISYQREGMER